MTDAMPFAASSKRVGLKPAFLYVLIILFFLLVATLGYLFISAAPKVRAPVIDEPDSRISSDSMINAIMHEKSASPLVMKQATITKAALMDEKAFAVASQAVISVYHQAPSGRSSLSLDGMQNHSPVSHPAAPKIIDAYQLQNGQSEKQQFMQNQRRVKPHISQQRVEAALSPYQLMAGTILPATLLTGINSDLPNQIIAKIRRPVFDSVSGNYLLIPQGASLIGEYDANVTYGQNRVLIAWQRIIFPNGKSLNLEGQPGADLAGMAGLKDKVDQHTFKLFSSALLMSVFNVAGQLSSSPNKTNAPSATQLITGAIAQQVSQTGAQLIAKQMNVQPTLVIRPGMNFNVLLTRDFVLPGPYEEKA